MKIDILNKQVPSTNDINATKENIKAKIEQLIKLKIYLIVAAVVVALTSLFAHISAIIIGAITITAVIAVVEITKFINHTIALCRKELKLLEIAEKETCLNIIHWIKNEDILSYHHLVLAQNRQFIQAEIVAMDHFYKSIKQRAKITLQTERVQLAYKQVYTGSSNQNN